MAGVAGGVAGTAGWWLVAGGLVAIAIAIRYKFNWSLPAAMIFLIALGWVYGWSAGQLQVTTCDEVEEKAAVVEGQPEYMEKQVRFVARIDECRILVSASPWLMVGRKDKVIISGGRRQSLAEVREFSAGYADYLARRGIGETWFFPDVQLAEMNTLDSWSISHQAQKLSDALRLQIQRLFTEPDASLVLGMLLAQKGTIPKEITEQFKATSVSHILAISGMNISIIAGIIYVFLSVLPMRKWTMTIVMLVTLWLYIVFIGAPVSVVRAGSFITVIMVLLRFNKLVSLPTALVMTIVVSVTMDPLVILDVGWQLSVGAVVGIFLILFVTKQMQPRLSKGGIGLWVYNVAIVSLGASLATWPLIMYHFGNVSLISLIANVLVVPVTAPILVLAPASIAVSWLWMGGGLILSGITHWFIWWMVAVTEVLSRWPGVYWQELVLPEWAVLGYFILLGGLAQVILWRQKRSWREVWA